jgi:hypothetical protein
MVRQEVIDSMYRFLNIVGGKICEEIDDIAEEPIYCDDPETDKERSF